MYSVFCKKLSKALSIITGILLIGVLVVSVINIILRNILSISVLILAPIQKLMFIWMIFIGATVVFHNNDHLKMDFFSNMFSPKHKRRINYFATIISMILFMIMIIFGFSISKIRMTIPFDSYKAIPTGYLYLALPVCSIIMMIFAIDHLVNLKKTGELVEIEKPDEEELRKQEEEIEKGIEEMKTMEKGEKK